MRRRLLSTIALMTMSASCAVGQSVPCSATDSKNALDQADRLRTWQTLYRTYKRYDQCDDGGIGEGFSESVARILADHWRTLAHSATVVLFGEARCWIPSFRAAPHRCLAQP